MRNKKIFGYVFVLGVLLFITIISSVFYSAIGANLSTLEEKKAQVINEKRILIQKLSVNNSLTKTADKANSLGWVKPMSFVYVAPSTVTALLH
jgi:hypothetical protein